jgi:hypothetical protein
VIEWCQAALDFGLCGPRLGLLGIRDIRLDPYGKHTGDMGLFLRIRITEFTYPYAIRIRLYAFTSLIDGTFDTKSISQMIDREQRGRKKGRVCMAQEK